MHDLYTAHFQRAALPRCSNLTVHLTGAPRSGRAAPSPPIFQRSDILRLQCVKSEAEVCRSQQRAHVLQKLMTKVCLLAWPAQYCAQLHRLFGAPRRRPVPPRVLSARMDGESKIKGQSKISIRIVHRPVKFIMHQL